MRRLLRMLGGVILLALGLAIDPARLGAGDPAPVAALRLPAADDELTSSVWVGFDPAGRYLAAYHLAGDGKVRLIVWDAPER